MPKIARSVEDIGKGRLSPFGFIWRELEPQMLRMVPFRASFDVHILPDGEGGLVCERGLQLGPLWRGVSENFLFDVLCGNPKSGRRAASFPPQTWLEGVAGVPGEGRNSRDLF